jgi:hypothetical protein
MINSHLLYQLSYRGMRRMLLIEKEKSSTEYFQPNTNRINSWASRRKTKRIRVRHGACKAQRVVRAPRFQAQC